MHEALYYKPHQQGVICELCPKKCVVREGQTGFCRVRQNVGGKLYAQNYAVCSAYAVDPIEKKPLYHFYPGSNIVSLGTWGCNFSCTFCQNWQIAQSSPETVELMPEKAVAAALAQGKQNVGIAYTYSEPSVWYEYILDTAKLVRQAGLKNVLVTNGFINPEPLAELLPYLDALNIDVKAFNDTFYQKICSGRLGAVKRTVEQAAAACHVEVTTLLIPGQNDDREELAALAKWLAALNPGIPLHFSRYFPNYKMAEPPTPPATLEMAWQTAREYLEYVYLGNMGTAGNNTYCPCCGYLVIDRTTRRSWLAADKKCPRCGSIIRLTGEVCY